jgi:hypothetical protein
MGLTHVDQSNPKWYQFLKRPTKTYYFGQQGQQPQGSVPDQADKQGPAANAAPGANGTGVTPNNQTPPNQADPGKDMGLLARMLYKPGNVTGMRERTPLPGTPAAQTPLSPVMQSQFDPTGYNPEYSEARNQIFQNRKRRIGDKLDTLYQKEADMDERYGQGLSAKEKDKMTKMANKFNRVGTKRGFNYSFKTYDEPKMEYKNGGSKGHGVGDVVDMTPEELQRFIEMGGQVEFLD